MKTVFVALLFAFFVWKFAFPSYQKYMDSGVIVEKSWVPRLPKDSPSVTFCALKYKIYKPQGWKTIKKKCVHFANCYLL